VAERKWLDLPGLEGARYRRVDLPVTLRPLELEARYSPKLWEALKRTELESDIRLRKLRLMRRELDRLRPEMPDATWKQLSEALGGFGDGGDDA